MLIFVLYMSIGVLATREAPIDVCLEDMLGATLPDIPLSLQFAFLIDLFGSYK